MRVRFGGAGRAPADDEVFVWCADLRWSECRRGPEVLDRTEHERARQFRTEAGRERFVKSHVYLREVLAGILGTAPEAVALTRRACVACGELHGKPVLADATEVRFNLSHADDLVIVAVAAHREVGVDIECARRAGALSRIASSFLTAMELSVLSELDKLARDQALLSQWTRKEALLKASGIGLNRPMTSLELPISGQATRPHHAGATTRWEPIVDLGERWLLADLMLEGARAAIAVSDQPVALRPMP